MQVPFAVTPPMTAETSRPSLDTSASVMKGTTVLLETTMAPADDDGFAVAAALDATDVVVVDAGADVGVVAASVAVEVAAVEVDGEAAVHAASTQTSAQAPTAAPKR